MDRSPEESGSNEKARDPPPFRMRQPCLGCGGEEGEIRTTNGQDCVYCQCGRHNYNAPKTETGRKERTVTTVHNGVKPKQRARILIRAGGRCELCKNENIGLHVGHALSVKDGLRLKLTEFELNSDENLLALCAECNLGISEETIPIWLLVGIIMARMKNHEPV